MEAGIGEKHSTHWRKWHGNWSFQWKIKVALLKMQPFGIFVISTFYINYYFFSNFSLNQLTISLLFLIKKFPLFFNLINNMSAKMTLIHIFLIHIKNVVIKIKIFTQRTPWSNLWGTTLEQGDEENFLWREWVCRKKVAKDIRLQRAKWKFLDGNQQ